MEVDKFDNNSKGRGYFTCLLHFLLKKNDTYIILMSLIIRLEKLYEDGLYTALISFRVYLMFYIDTWAYKKYSI